jgi:hypothetical protein
LVRNIIHAGATSGVFDTDDADAAAWRLLSVLDGLALQVVAHDALITRNEVVTWTRIAAARELQVTDGASQIR